MGLAVELAGVLKPEVLLSEKNDGVELRDSRSGMKVRVFGLPAPSTVVHVENVGHMGKLRDRGLEHAGHLRRICDYLLIVESRGRTQAVFVELKETWSDEERPRDQLRRSLPLLKYLSSVCEVEYGSAPGDHGIATYYWIIFQKRNRKLNKQSVNAHPARKRDGRKYKDITVRTFVGTSIPFETLLDE